MEQVTQTRDLQDFTRIDLRAAGAIDLTQGRDFSFTMTSDEALHELIETVIEGDTLIIKFVEDTQKIKSGNDIRYTITMPLIAGVRISGGGSLHCGNIAGKSFALDLPGGSSIHIQSIAVADFRLRVQGGSKLTLGHIQAARIHMDIPGSANMTIADLSANDLTIGIRGTINLSIAGRVMTQTINVVGVANIKAEHLQSNQATVKSLGIGNVDLWVTDTLDVVVSGAGSVKYYGDPSVKKSMSGIGRVQKIGDTPVPIV